MISKTKLERCRAEIGKILLQARLLRIHTVVSPWVGGKNEPLLQFDIVPGENIGHSFIPVHHDGLFVSFLFHAHEEKVLKLQIPGINCVYHDYRRNAEHHKVCDENGLVQAMAELSPTYIVRAIGMFP